MLEMDEWLLFVVMNEHDAPSVSLQYRAVLDQLLSRNSWDLSSRQEKDLAVEDEEGEEIWEMSECLVDESLRAFFVNGVVHLLEHDTAKTNKKQVLDSAAAEVVAMLLLTVFVSSLAVQNNYHSSMV